MKILTGKPRILLETIRRTGAGQLVLIRFGKGRQWEKRHGEQLAKKGFIDPMEPGPERGSYFCRWTGKDPDTPDQAFDRKGMRHSLSPDSPQFPAKIREEFPLAIKFRRYRDGLKTVEIPVPE